MLKLLGKRLHIGINVGTRLCGWCSTDKEMKDRKPNLFQCRTRLCGWCSAAAKKAYGGDTLFQCRTRLCGWCSSTTTLGRGSHPSFNAARGFVCGAALHGGRHALFTASFNAARGFVGGAASSLAALVPLGEKALLESLRKFESSDGKYVKYPFLFSFSLRRKPLRDQHLARP